MKTTVAEFTQLVLECKYVVKVDTNETCSGVISVLDPRKRNCCYIFAFTGLVMCLVCMWLHLVNVACIRVCVAYNIPWL